MSYTIEERLLGILIANNLANLSDRSETIGDFNMLDYQTLVIDIDDNFAKKRKKSIDGKNVSLNASKSRSCDKSVDINLTNGIDGDDDMTARILAQAAQTEHCLVLYHRLLDLTGTMDACIDLLGKNLKIINSNCNDRIGTAIRDSKDPNTALVAAFLIAASLIRDITANGIYAISEPRTSQSNNPFQPTISISSTDLNLSAGSANSPTNTFKGTGFIEAIHSVREIAMRDNSDGFDTLKIVMDKVGGRVSREVVFVYRKVLVQLIGLLQTPLMPCVKELLYESIGHLCVYINDIADIDDAGMDLVDTLIRLSPRLTSKLLAVLPNALDSKTLNCSKLARESYVNYILSSFEKVFGILNEKPATDDSTSDIYMAVHNWLEFVYKLKKNVVIMPNMSTVAGMVDKLIIEYLNANGCVDSDSICQDDDFDVDVDIDFYMNEILNLVSKLCPECFKALFDSKNLKSKIISLNLHSKLRLFSLLWNNLEFVSINSILDLLDNLVVSLDENLVIIMKFLSKLHQKTPFKLPKSHKVYQKITQLIKLPGNFDTFNPPYNLFLNIYQVRRVFLPFISSICKISPFKELKNHQLDDKKVQWEFDAQSANFELCLFLLQATNNPSFDEIDLSGSNENIYCLFALASLSKISLSINNIEKALALSYNVYKTVTKFYTEFQALNDVIDDIFSDIQLLLNKLIMLKDNAKISTSAWNVMKNFDNLYVPLLLGNLSKNDDQWPDIGDKMTKELTAKLNEFVKSPKSFPNPSDYLLIAHKILLLNLGNDKLDINSIKAVSKVFKLFELFQNNELYSSLFFVYNRCLTCNVEQQGNLDLLAKMAQGVWEDFISYTIDFLDDKSISSIEESIVYVATSCIEFRCNEILSKLLTGYQDLLDKKIAFQIHAAALVKLISRLISNFSTDGTFFTKDLEVDIANMIFKCILLAREYPNIYSDLTGALVKCLKILKTLVRVNEGSISSFELDLEIRHKRNILGARVGMLKDLEVGKTSPVTLDHALLIFVMQNHYMKLNKFAFGKYENELIKLINPPYQLLRMVARELCDLGSVNEVHKKELSDFIDKYVLPMFVKNNRVSPDFCTCLDEFLRLRRPKLERPQTHLKLVSVLKGAEAHFKKASI